MALSDTRKISNLRKIFLFYIVEHVLIYFVEFFHVFVLLMLAAIELIKISKIFRNWTKTLLLTPRKSGQIVSQMGQVSFH